MDVLSRAFVRVKDDIEPQHLPKNHPDTFFFAKASPEGIEAIRLALRHKSDLRELGNVKQDVTLGQGLSVGAVWTLFEVARQLGIVDALGATRQGRLALWPTIARVIDQGSRLSAVRLAGAHAACDILNLEACDEDDLYENLDWLCAHQSAIIVELARRWEALDVTVEEGIKGLCSLCATEVVVKGVTRCIQIPAPREALRQLLEAAEVRLPEALPSRGIAVTSNRPPAERVALGSPPKGGVDVRKAPLGPWSVST